MGMRGLYLTSVTAFGLLWLMGARAVLLGSSLKDTPGGPDECTVDEICTIGDTCAPRPAEVRFCMRRCSSAGDCRDDYECRDKELMIAHGGEPVPDIGRAVDADPQNFCAMAPLE